MRRTPSTTCLGAALLLLGLGAPGCAPEGEGPIRDAVCGEVSRTGPVNTGVDGKACEKLGSHRLFEGIDGDGDLIPAEGVEPYRLNTPLFSDYALKDRTIWMPAGESAAYREDEPFEFPVGTIISKTFSFAEDLREPTEDIRIIETRLLVRTSDGWQARPYVWNRAQTEATYSPLGAAVEVAFTKPDGTATETTYRVPNVNQCKECHGTLDPETGEKTLGLIGPKTKHLNRELAYQDGTRNQLAHLADVGYLDGVTASPEALPRLARWDDPEADLDARARAYLDANCAHCHNPEGVAHTSGLLLASEVTEPALYGVCKVPIRSVGEGATHDIYPGSPSRSASLIRMDSDVPRTMMPRLGRTLIHDEGVALIREWIAAMDGSCE